MPFSGLGTTPGAAPSGNPEAMVRREPSVEIHLDQLPGTGVDDVQPVAVDQNALRTVEFGRHGFSGRTR